MSLELDLLERAKQYTDYKVKQGGGGTTNDAYDVKYNDSNVGDELDEINNNLFGDGAMASKIDEIYVKLFGSFPQPTAAHNYATGSTSDTSGRTVNGPNRGTFTAIDSGYYVRHIYSGVSGIQGQLTKNGEVIAPIHNDENHRIYIVPYGVGDVISDTSYGRCPANTWSGTYTTWFQISFQQ